MRISPVTLDEISDKLTALSDILNVALELPNQMVAIENAIDRQTEALEKIYEALKPASLEPPGDPDELEAAGFPVHAKLLREGRVS